MEADREALYTMLTPQDVAEKLDISLRSAYELFRRKDFPALRTGQRKGLKVSKVAFDRWLMGKGA